MSNSSILGGESAATRAAGRDVDLLGPSDSSDSGSDVQGEQTMATDADNPGELGAVTTDLDSDSDALGTGERRAAAGDAGRDGGDILPDRIISPDVEGDALVDADFSDEIEGLDSDSDGDDVEGSDEAPGASQAESTETESGGRAAGGRVHALPPGTIEAAEER